MKTVHKRHIGRGLFVTGTDTGVGKTVVAAGIVTAMRKQGVDAVPMKAVQTGCLPDKGGLVSPDLRFALRMNGLDPAPDELQRMCPYRFLAPCSPHLAARLAGKRVSLGVIQQAFEWLRERHEVVVVEGAAGILAPLGPVGSVLSLMRTLDLPVLVVARAGLGTLNHTLLTVNEIRRAGLRIAGVVLNQIEPAPWGLIEDDNAMTIEKVGRVRVLAVIPHRRGGSGDPRLFRLHSTRRLGGIRWSRLLRA